MKPPIKPRHKVRLDDTVASLLLSKEGYIGQLADAAGVDGQTIKRQLKAQSPTLCLPHYLKAIENILSKESAYKLIHDSGKEVIMYSTEAKELIVE